MNNFPAALALHMKLWRPLLLVMPKYWEKQIFAHGRFPEVGQKQKTERKKEEEKKIEERLNDGNNNGQL